MRKGSRGRGWKGPLSRGSAAAVLAFTIVAAAAMAGTSGPYAIDSSVVAAGGATLAGGGFRLSGTVAQPATTPLSASGFSLYAGFWAPEGSASDAIFANGFDP